MSQVDAIPLPAVLWRRLPALGIAPAALLRNAGLPLSLLAETDLIMAVDGYPRIADLTPDALRRVGR